MGYVDSTMIFTQSLICMIEACYNATKMTLLNLNANKFPEGRLLHVNIFFTIK